MTPPHSSSLPRNTLLAALRTQFPVFRENKPLALGIHKVIKERLPDTDSKRLRLAMQTHTASTAYLKSLTNGGSRFDLDDNPVGEVTPGQQQQALEALRERFRKANEKRKAEKRVQEEKLKSEQQAREKHIKLLQLAEKFNAR
jgi:ProP effector